jgi:CRISPR-associated protein Csd1
MLNRLVEYGQKLVTPLGYGPQDIKWMIVINKKGEFKDLLPLGEDPKKEGWKGGHFPSVPAYPQNLKQSKTKRVSDFLWETFQTVALFGCEEDTKYKAKHEFFKKLIEIASEKDKFLEPITLFFKKDSSLERLREKLSSKEGLENTDKCCFGILSASASEIINTLESDSWKPFWDDYFSKLSLDKRSNGKNEKDLKPSLLDGKCITPALVHNKIKNLGGVGGRSKGDSLISFDKNAFCSFGLKQGANAPLSQESAKAYVEGLNHLILHNSRTLHGVKYIYWYKTPVEKENDPLSFLDSRDGIADAMSAEASFAKLLDGIRSGKRVELSGNQFYLLILSGNLGRVIIRTWLESTVGEIVENINSWFSDLNIVSTWGEYKPSPGISKILDVLKKPKKRDGREKPKEDSTGLPTNIVGQLFISALQGGPIPEALHWASLNRFKMNLYTRKKGRDNDWVTTNCMSILKIWIRRNKGMKEINDKLNESIDSDAYHCGRLMAVYEAIQRESNKDVSVGVVERYYAAASVTPGLILGKLAKLSNYHLSQLEPDLAYILKTKLSEIAKKISSSIPSVFSLTDQSLFALGYYHQIAHDRAEREMKAKTEEKELTKNQDVNLSLEGGNKQ